jgi:Zn-dependent peptidase ImmA (M78 family)
LEELRAFSERYSVSESELLSDSRQPLDIEVKFRSNSTPSNRESEQISVSTLLSKLAASVVEMESLLGTVPVPPDLPSISVHRDEPLEQQAEDMALSIRQRLGIGLGPIPNLISMMESDFGLRVFERPLASNVSGAVVYDDVYGGFVLLNSRHTVERRRQTAAHEICHPLLRKVGLSVHLEDESFEEREEKFCDAFGRALLMPAVSVRKRATELRAISGDFTVRHLLMMAIYFFVSIEAMARRLEHLALVPKGLFESLKERGLGIKHLESVRQDMATVSSAPQFTPRLLLLAGATYDKGYLSEQQIAQKLDLDLVTVRKMLAEVSEIEE